MIYVLSTLAAISVVLFISSFFMNDRLKDLEEQIEHVSLTMMQNNYQTKQKLKVLEEELLAEDLTGEIMKQPFEPAAPKKKQQPPLLETVHSMYQKGYKVHYIAKQTDLSEHDVQSLVQQWKSEGVQR